MTFELVPPDYPPHSTQRAFSLGWWRNSGTDSLIGLLSDADALLEPQARAREWIGENAMAEAKRGFPMLPVNHWWALRKKFKQSIPGVITDNYLSTVLNMGVNSARANVLPFLKSLGIIDEDGKPKERAKLWRDDGHYPEVCQAILTEVYPKDLLDAVPDPKTNRDMAQRWMANHTGAGEGACRRMVALYTVLVEADPSGAPEPGKARESKKPAKKSPQRERPARSAKAPSVSNAPPAASTAQNTTQPTGPGININLQVHISADASPDQIEQIFAAMAKHIYRTT